jgi:galactonate dehydratase
LEAATEVASIVRNLCEQGGLYHNFWVGLLFSYPSDCTIALDFRKKANFEQFTHYYAFSAIAVLYVHFIHMCSQAVNIEQYLYYFQIGEQAQNDLATCSGRSPSVRRYLVVLEELREEAKKATKRCQQALGITLPISEPQHVTFADNVLREAQRMDDNRQLNIPDIIANQDAVQLMALSQVQSDQPGLITGSKDEAYADSDIPNLAAWGDLDSLAFTGLGELDFTFPSELLPPA